MEAAYGICPFNNTKVLLGDLKAKIRREEMYRGLRSRHSLHVNINYNGQRLVDFAAAKNMVVSSTCQPHKEIHKDAWWRSPDGKPLTKLVVCSLVEGL